MWNLDIDKKYTILPNDMGKETLEESIRSQKWNKDTEYKI